MIKKINCCTIAISVFQLKKKKKNPWKKELLDSKAAFSIEEKNNESNCDQQLSLN